MWRERAGVSRSASLRSTGDWIADETNDGVHSASGGGGLAWVSARKARAFSCRLALPYSCRRSRLQAVAISASVMSTIDSA
jgi:hypothetical protein